MLLCSALADADGQNSSAPGRQVSYIHSSTVRLNRDTVDLLDGTRWLLLSTAVILPISDVVIVVDSSFSTMFVDGWEVPVQLIKGDPIVQTGTLAQVVRASRDGAVLTLSDGSQWNVPSYDRYHTSYWLTPYPALLTSSRLYLYNLRKVKRIWVSRR